MLIICGFCFSGYYEIAESLLLAGADLSITNYRSHTPFQESLAMNHMHISPLFSTNNNNSDSLLSKYTGLSIIAECGAGRELTLPGAGALSPRVRE